MAIDIEHSRTKRGVGISARRRKHIEMKDGVSVYVLSSVSLWALLWLGYNTSYGYMASPKFSTDTSYFIHGIRAFSPVLAAWISFAIIFARPQRIFSWIIGPLGLMLLYAVVGLVSSAAYSPEPVYSMYYGANYLAIVLVLFAIVSLGDSLPNLRQVLNFTWVVGILITLSLLGAIPFLGKQALVETESSPVGVRAYSGETEIMGMASSRNTGFARYAAIAALVCLARFMKKGKLSTRMIWGSLFIAATGGLVIANGRTETIAFIAGLVVVLTIEKAKRTVNILLCTLVAIVLALRGFFSGFFIYMTRTGRIDPTMTGRTTTWDHALRVFGESPWVGFGFQADRLYLGGEHMHNALLHAYFQAGLIGGTAILVGLLIVWAYTIKYFFIQRPADLSLTPAEYPAVLLFTTISSITESTFAYFSAAWLLTAPIVPYVMALHRKIRGASLHEVRDRVRRLRIARRNAQSLLN